MHVDLFIDPKYVQYSLTKSLRNLKKIGYIYICYFMTVLLPISLKL